MEFALSLYQFYECNFSFNLSFQFKSMFFAASKQQVSYTDFRDVNNEWIYFQRVKPFDVLQVESHVIPLALHRF